MSFDVVGTLVDFGYEDYVLKYDRIGRNDIRWYLPERWFKHFNLDEDPIEVFRSHVDKVRFYPEVPSVLRNLSKKYCLVIISGATRNVIEIMIEKFKRYFKYIYSPVSDRNEVKKTPQLYKMVCKILEIEPCFMVHVGDEWYSYFISKKYWCQKFLSRQNRRKRWKFRDQRFEGDGTSSDYMKAHTPKIFNELKPCTPLNCGKLRTRIL